MHSGVKDREEASPERVDQNMVTEITICLLSVITLVELKTNDYTTEIRADLYTCVRRYAPLCNISASLTDVAKHNKCSKCTDCKRQSESCLLSKLKENKYRGSNQVKAYIKSLTRRQ
ncbi:hypothetical protein EG68_04798 [Paragonimus skrjabini miyazakii]|uniref:Uncharacterized protein n=1 Tax=Paragonimus skrjabini miyazakii TaxID=59628 RepID=A0A8S9YYR5_9TREM|nr:hypothetical protein EG68_04798 [Paragonimus skrjabini miyazakii]